MILDTLLIDTWVTLKLALLSASVLLIISIFFAWWIISLSRVPRLLVEAFLSLPLVLPPTVIGFYLLLVLNPKGPLMGLLQKIGINEIVFTFSGILIGVIIHSLPLVIRPIILNYERINSKYLETAYTLGKNRIETFWSVIVPLSKRTYLFSFLIGMAHALGEFGVVLMVGGNIPSKTRVLSITLYDLVESNNFEMANKLALAILGFSFVVVLLVFILNSRNLDDKM